MLLRRERDAEIVPVAGVHVPMMGDKNESEITKEEVENYTKTEKAPGVNGVNASM